jgi:hypothetical protein
MKSGVVGFAVALVPWGVMLLSSTGVICFS